MQRTVRMHTGSVTVGEEVASLLSGAVHYWRLNPNNWKAILTSVQEMGLETVETYIPWEFHEISRNSFDFTGETDSRRDLEGFLRLVKEMGFWLIVRPGPYIYSEWVNMGVPTDVAKYHRMHPAFTSRASKYIEAVSGILFPFQASRGGNIIMLQPDNETDAFEYCYEEQLGLGSKPGLFQDFLRRKYGDLSRLNHRWGATYASFDEAKPIMSAVTLGSEYEIRYHDFFEFRADYINKCVQHYANEYRKNGIDIPLLHNTYDILGVQDLMGLSNVVDLVGVDAYPSNEFRSKTFASGEQVSHRRLEEIFRYQRTFSKTSYIAEYESGIGHGLHYYSGVLEPNQYSLTFLTAVGSGVHAWNWYMLVARDNWYMCPINEWGRKHRELFRIYKENVALYKRMNVPMLEKVTDTSAFIYLGHQLSKEASNDPTLTAIYDAGVDYEFFNGDTGQIRKPVLFYSGDRWLPRAHQERLEEYVQSGGHLVFFQTLPMLDEDRNSCNVLGLMPPQRVTNEPFLDHLATETEVEIGGEKVRTRAPFYVYDETSGVPIYGERADADIRDTDFEENRYLRSLVIGHRYQVGYHEQRGDGSITVLGTRPNPAFIRALHAYLGIPIYIFSHIPSVKPALFRGENSMFAILINLDDQRVHVPIDLALESLVGENLGATSMRPGFSVDDRMLSEGRLYVDIPRKDGTVIQIRSR